jgi:hypothetical protein
VGEKSLDEAFDVEITVSLQRVRTVTAPAE